ncbi:hypothetical protein JYQ62_10740 [Nostoc sp. UHCC 0702]|nr:hypothetical protein JYQ62_10740 [Nostoc sp. UHCC 0702]
MPENLPNDANETAIITNIDAFTISGKSVNRMILIGAPEWVKGVTYRLHSLGFADLAQWSRLMPTRNSKQMITVLQRPRVQE